MSAVQTAQLGDYGYPVQVDIVDQNGVAINVSNATTLQITLTRPDGTQVTYTAVFTTTGVDGKIRYVLQNGDLGTPTSPVAWVGDWHVQGAVFLPGVGWRTGKGYFAVRDNL